MAYLLVLIVMCGGFLLGYYLRKRFLYGNSRRTYSTYTPEPVYRQPLPEQEVQHLLEEIRRQYQIWLGPGYWHKNTVIEFEKDHVRFSAITGDLSNFFAGWDFPYSRDLHNDPCYPRFRMEMADRTLAMLKSCYPDGARDLYRDGGCLIFPTNGKFSR